MKQHDDRKTDNPDDKGIGNEIPPRKPSAADVDAQRHGNLGNERNRSDVDTGGDRGGDGDTVKP